MRYFLFLPLILISQTSRTGPTTPTLSGDGVPNLLPRNRVLRLLVWAQAAGKTAANRPFRYRR